jgi:hypothetical protein
VITPAPRALRRAAAATPATTATTAAADCQHYQLPDRQLPANRLSAAQGAGQIFFGKPRGGWVIQSTKKGWGQIDFFDFFYRGFELPSRRNAQKRDKQKSRKIGFGFLVDYFEKGFDMDVLQKLFLWYFRTPLADKRPRYQHLHWHAPSGDVVFSVNICVVFLKSPHSKKKRKTRQKTFEKRDKKHRAVLEYRGAVFAGVPGVLLGHGGDHPRYASYVEVPRNFSIVRFYTHICMMTRLDAIKHAVKVHPRMALGRNIMGSHIDKRCKCTLQDTYSSHVQQDALEPKSLYKLMNNA